MSSQNTETENASAQSAESEQACVTELPAFCQTRHWSIYWILIIASVAMVAGMVLRVDNVNDKQTFFSANDRSRWCTVRSLVDHGTYEIDQVIASPDAPWDSIDKVVHVGHVDGEMHSYSSKPPLLPTMIAGVYWLVKNVTGWNLAEHPLAVSRAVLVFVSVIPWALFMWCLARTIDRIAVRDWTRYFVLGCAGFGTLLIPFNVSLSNHLPGAISVMVALMALHEIMRPRFPREMAEGTTPHWFWYALAGLCGAFAVANELPALAFFGLAGLLCLFKSFSKTFLAFVPAALLVVGAFFYTNYLGHGEWKLPYMHRGDGAVLAELDGDFAQQLDSGSLPRPLKAAYDELAGLSAPRVEKGAWPTTPKDVARWVVRDAVSPIQFAITKKGADGAYQIREWGNWYDYPRSYWRADNDRRSIVDQGQESQALYAFHILFGHHGIFSLTPIWLLSVAGMIVCLCSTRLRLNWLGAMAIILSIVVVAFYIVRPALDRNYGGYTCGLRWLFWLAPIWLVAMLPVVDWLGRTKSGRAFCLVLLALSAVTAMYHIGNPWTHPWLYEAWEITGLPK